MPDMPSEFLQRKRHGKGIQDVYKRQILDSSLQHHIQNAKKHGVTAVEMAELLTHAAFYAGWPKAWAAPVSYTHLDVYKRQPNRAAKSSREPLAANNSAAFWAMLTAVESSLASREVRFAAPSICTSTVRLASRKSTKSSVST